MHLAEINVARLRAPLTDPRLADFVAHLDAINALAEDSPGFVWRLKAEAGAPSSYIKFSDDELTIVNMSVWTSIDALFAYVYRSGHGEIYRNRRTWFEPLANPFVLWWIAEGDVPSIDEGRRRLEMLAHLGPTPDAFTFKTRFDASSLTTSSAAG
ncbi:MAG TPA: DUF3291 domain-containing protein [Vicinamibacterales bacterium]|nr:DUF3291 domain-containing protein [Vicinamibacterales bacterium]